VDQNGFWYVAFSLLHQTSAQGVESHLRKTLDAKKDTCFIKPIVFVPDAENPCVIEAWDSVWELQQHVIARQLHKCFLFSDKSLYSSFKAVQYPNM